MVIFHGYVSLPEGILWVKQCHKPQMTGNGKFIPPINMVMAGAGNGLLLFANITVYTSRFCNRQRMAIMDRVVYTSPGVDDNDKARSCQVFKV